MLTKLVLSFALLAFVRADSTNVQRCTSNPGELPLNTYVVGCGEPPCDLPQLQDAVLNIRFQAPRTLNNLRTLATAYLRVGLIWIPVPYDLGENSVACNFLTNTQCPVAAGEIVEYTLRMYIEPFFPVGTSTTVEFRVLDEGNDPVFCIRLPINITAPESA